MKRAIAIGLGLLAQLAAAAGEIHTGSIILLDITRAGSGLIAVGERGTMLRSEDSGGHWKALPSGVTRTLTAVAFASPAVGVAVGHGGTLLRSGDGGQSWQKLAPEGLDDQSLLGVTCLGPDLFAAYGAFGLLLTSEDGGQNWRRREVVGPDFDRHLYGLVAFTPRRWLLAGESGTLIATEDGGATWRTLSSPYEGSFFGAVKTRDGGVILYGMRGHVYRGSASLDGWTAIDTGTEAAYNAGRLLADGRIVLAGNNGVVAISGDDGRSFQKFDLGRAVNLAGAADDQGALLFASDQGLRRLAAASSGY